MNHLKNYFAKNTGRLIHKWKHYFGPQAKIFGIDTNSHCRQLEEQQVRIFNG
jgi:hypothetical protein